MLLNEILRTNARPVTVHLEPWMYQSREEIEQWIEAVCKQIPSNYTDKAVVGADLEIIYAGDLYFTPSYHKLENIMKSDSELDWIKILKKHGHQIAGALAIHHDGEVLLPVQFKSVTRNLSCSIPFTSMIGFPFEIHGELSVESFCGKDLHGFPRFIGGPRASIEFLNDIEDFAGMDQSTIVKELTMLSKNKAKILSFNGFPNRIQKLHIGCDVVSLDGIGKSRLQEISISHNVNPIKGLYKVLSIESLKKFTAYNDGTSEKLLKAVEIINGHLAGSRDMIGCKRELISAGLKEYA